MQQDTCKRVFVTELDEPLSGMVEVAEMTETDGELLKEVSGSRMMVGAGGGGYYDSTGDDSDSSHDKKQKRRRKDNSPYIKKRDGPKKG